jgi:MoaA/NifB/PqqE/SkfB family radical SAM enzyme
MIGGYGEHENEFCLFRIPAEGARVLWQITNRCNYQCSYCIFSSGLHVAPQELNYEEALGVLSQLRQENFTHIKFTGGEPFSRPDFLKILTRAKELGFVSDVSTNAAYLTRDKARALSSCNLSLVHVSLDGADEETHEVVRGPNTFAPTVRGLRHLLEEGIPVRVGCVVHAHNEGSLDAVAHFCLSLGVPEIIFSRMEPVGRLAPGSALVAKSSDETLLAQCKALGGEFGTRLRIVGNFKGTQYGDIEVSRVRQRHITKVSSHGSLRQVGEGSRPGCPGGTRFLFIDSLGRVSPCSWISETSKRYVSETSLKQQPLGTLLSSGACAEFKDFLLAGADAGKSGCPLHWQRSE